jgi:phage replication O-like protein O
MNIGIDFEKFQQRDSVQVMTNYTKMPNTIIDDCIMAGISDKAFKCLMFIMRQTVGFNRTSHTIATTQFQKYCGIKKDETVAKVVRELEQCKLITVERKTGCLNSYTLTINQYHETVLPPSKGATPTKGGYTTPTKGGYTTPTKGGYTTPTKGGSIKENFKENFKESSSEGKPQFKVQENVIAGYVTYFMNDGKYYSLFELESLYSVDVDFVNQALASYPSLTLKIDNFSEMFNEMRQWSLTANAGKKQPQQWMNTWLTWVKNNAHKFNEKPKQSTYQPKPKVQQVPLIGSNKLRAERTVNTFDALEMRDV